MSKSQGRRKFDINIRTVVAFRKIGKGLSIGDPNYHAINEELLSAYEYVANKSMAKTAIEVSAKAHDVPLILTDAGLVNCEVLVDGSWQKRGKSLLKRVVTAMSDGKCLDVHVLSKHCKRCRIWEQKKDTSEHKDWKATHQCNINHEKSSGSMEAAGAVELFEHLVQKHKLVYSQYLGDSDISLFKEVVESKPYSEFGIVPEKDFF